MRKRLENFLLATGIIITAAGFGTATFNLYHETSDSFKYYFYKASPPLILTAVASATAGFSLRVRRAYKEKDSDNRC